MITKKGDVVLLYERTELDTIAKRGRLVRGVAYHGILSRTALDRCRVNRPNKIQH
jgi:hypothetical protein